MIESFKALAFTLIGAMATALITLFLQNLPSKNVPDAKFRYVEIGGFLKIPFDLRSKDAVLSDIFGEAWDIFKNSPLRPVIAPIIYEISFLNAGESRLKSFEVVGERPFLAVGSVSDRTQMTTVRAISWSSDNPLKIPPLDPGQSYRVAFVQDKNFGNVLPIRIIYDDKIIRPQPIFEDSNDFYGAHDFIYFHPSASYILLISMSISLVTIVIGITFSTLIRWNIAWARYLYSKSDIARMRTIVAYFDARSEKI